MDVNVTQCPVAGVNESVGRVCRNCRDGTAVHLALLVTDRDGGGALNNKRNFNVRMSV